MCLSGVRMKIQEKIVPLLWLGEDVCSVILSHLSASLIWEALSKRAARRRFLYSTLPGWGRLERGVWEKKRQLASYPLVTKEWREEQESWVYSVEEGGEDFLDTILAECREGMWGKAYTHSPVGDSFSVRQRYTEITYDNRYGKVFRL